MLKSVYMVLLLVALMIAIPLFADGDVDYQDVRRLTQSGKILPLTELLRRIQASKPGRVIEVELERKGKAYIYEIEILDELGVVWEYKLDAVNGEILELELED
ncbi:MAG: PepSY domain-containing protein [Candidatus Thiodiazotropha lotti]|uniref:PepSY domain-containing protein n=1 Tax=Candidatus Thiodiazotropha endoloripes TaxID=1818881 RepID=A0A1E2UT61_9GAMM|nr:PepSY domain-containing protein [Candidatus Thiodiazotropha endoloripes]MCG7898545.1 PepSY domain-containing protein [Candidatus Thiodiazotropha weberae]MCG7990826.1 PepSY domain-containing protein [Candidatus Thiodiazotropha lotti]MCG7901457.1 PepSY domain-containing protein [Candidatus Thiodiazotropha weberae]MCG7913735.1 PepSY domain-containing protein [Candidatus Thiodiazotropha weberae]MCG7999310.1 PepSY domain-containing protein [Candidatus Thiodiazotropha lotti]